MLLTWILVSLAVLLASGEPRKGGPPKGGPPQRTNRNQPENAIFFPGEVNTGSEERDDGLEEFYNNPDDRIYLPGDPEDTYNVDNDFINRNTGGHSFESPDEFDYDPYAELEPFNFVNEEDFVELPDWMDTDLNELSLDKLAILNNATDLEDLAELFELDDENREKLSGEWRANNPQPDLAADSRSRNPNADIVEKNNEMAKFAKCNPEKVTVGLEVPKNALYLPSCVRLKRCGGCCNNDLLSCQPTKTEVLSLNVLKISKTGSNRRRRVRRSRSRRRRRASGQIVSLPQENHVECSCQCKVQAHHCNQLLHIYNKDVCACVCKNQSEQMTCEKSNSLHYWNKNLCKCMCRRIRECSTGEMFSQDTCRCVPVFAGV
ncbi:unnamed protein product [Meganyctiphanes norvegica]|uniref:Platelet-derived growth factor (PDGF) family profile domain-containing protein n=1 Tax=Meganyctiphanes norvegica TaxID=48144 RepID=A0AAV2QRW8_MEGNR